MKISSMKIKDYKESISIMTEKLELMKKETFDFDSTILNNCKLN